jgi:alanine dehydrogenase
MIVGILKEIKARENRVSMTPAGVEVLTKNGHTVLVEKEAGDGSGFNGDSYQKAGAKLLTKRWPKHSIWSMYRRKIF